MQWQEFISTLPDAAPPPGVSILLQAMWWDAKGDWAEAHGLVDHLENRNACRVHAYLHRKEGDLWNAQYWYNKAGRDMPTLSLEKEWEEIVAALL